MDKKAVEVIRMRDDFVRLRLALHIINLTIHVVNLKVLDAAGESYRESITNPNLQVALFRAMRFRYLTTWVVMLHIFYSVSSLVLELCPQMIKSQKKAPNPQDPVEKYEMMIKHPSGILFKGIIWPSTILVIVFFWSLFNYDREVIFPKFLDEVVSCLSNHILHTWIAIFMFLEMLVHPRLRPYPSTLGQAAVWRATIMFLALYGIVFYFTVYNDGIWLYPIFEVAYNSGLINFFVLHLIILLLYFSSTHFFWRVDNRIDKLRLWVIKKTRNYRILWGPAVGSK